MSEPKTVSLNSVRWSIIGVVLFSALISLTVAFLSLARDDQITRNTMQICMNSNYTANSVNAVLDTLIISVNETTSLPATEKAIRAKRYAKAKVPLITCDTQAVKR